MKGRGIGHEHHWRTGRPVPRTPFGVSGAAGATLRSRPEGVAEPAESIAAADMVRDGHRTDRPQPAFVGGRRGILPRGATVSKKRHLGRDREPGTRVAHDGSRVGAACSLVPALCPGGHGSARARPCSAVGRPRPATVQGQLEELVARGPVLRPGTESVRGPANRPGRQARALHRRAFPAQLRTRRRMSRDRAGGPAPARRRRPPAVPCVRGGTCSVQLGGFESVLRTRGATHPQGARAVARAVLAALGAGGARTQPFSVPILRRSSQFACRTGTR